MGLMGIMITVKEFYYEVTPSRVRLVKDMAKSINKEMIRLRNPEHWDKQFNEGRITKRIYKKMKKLAMRGMLFAVAGTVKYDNRVFLKLQIKGTRVGFYTPGFGIWLNKFATKDLPKEFEQRKGFEITVKKADKKDTKELKNIETLD